MIDKYTHWDHIRGLGCCISCTNIDVTIHHCHSGSITEYFGLVGWAMRQSDMLVIPLAAKFHTGCYGIDSSFGVLAWEQQFGTQIDHLRRVAVQIRMLYGYDIFEEAGVPSP